MAEALLIGERDSQILAAREIANLTTKQKQKLAGNEAISPLIPMLHSQDDDSIEAALFALLNLAFGSERNKALMMKAGAIPAVLKVLQWRNGSLMELALAALLILSSCTGNRPGIASSGAIQKLLELLDSNVGYQAKFDILSTLHNLSTSPQIVPLMVVSGGLVAAVRLIYESEKSSELVEKATALLESIVSSSQVALNQACETGDLIAMLVEAVEEGTMACQEHAAGILLMICKSCRERYRVIILREGAIVGLLQLSIHGTWIARKKAKALLLLLRDCDNDGGSSLSSSSRAKQWKNVMLKKVMRQIDREERGGTSVQMVEEMIAKLST